MHANDFEKFFLKNVKNTLIQKAFLPIDTLCLKQLQSLPNSTSVL
jgi:hypothetical protein